MQPALRQILFGRRAISTEAQQFFDRLATPPTATRAALYDTAIRATVAAGIWGKLDWLHVAAASDQATALVNLKSSSYAGIKAGAVGTPTFTADRGWVGTASSYINSQFNPSTAGGNWTRDSAAGGIWSLTSTVQTTAALIRSSYANGAVIELFPRYTADVFLFSINVLSGDTDSSVANADGSGLFGVSRTASNVTTATRNGVSLGTSNKASAALTNDTIVYGSPNQTALAFGGSGLTVAETLALYNAWLPYMQGVGAA